LKIFHNKDCTLPLKCQYRYYCLIYILSNQNNKIIIIISGIQLFNKKSNSNLKKIKIIDNGLKVKISFKL